MRLCSGVLAMGSWLCGRFRHLFGRRNSGGVSEALKPSRLDRIVAGSLRRVTGAYFSRKPPFDDAFAHPWFERQETSYSEGRGET